MVQVIALVHESAGIFGISFPDFPGCISTANSLDEAVHRGRSALGLHLGAMMEDGLAVPSPRSLAALCADPDLAKDIAEAVAAVPVRLAGEELGPAATSPPGLLLH